MLVSPEDVGLGPGVRGRYGRGMPESSFLFFRRDRAQQMRSLCRTARRTARTLWKFGRLREFDFRGAHVTHNIPALLSDHKYSWQSMEVLTSPRMAESWYAFRNGEGAWDEEWAHYVYGFGNFYRLDGVVTHYHQWYARATAGDTERMGPRTAPVEFLRQSQERFARDYERGQVLLPDPAAVPLGKGALSLSAYAGLVGAAGSSQGPRHPTICVGDMERDMRGEATSEL